MNLTTHCGVLVLLDHPNVNAIQGPKAGMLKMNSELLAVKLGHISLNYKVSTATMP